MDVTLRERRRIVERKKEKKADSIFSNSLWERDSILLERNKIYNHNISPTFFSLSSEWIHEFILFAQMDLPLMTIKSFTEEVIMHWKKEFYECLGEENRKIQSASAKKESPI